MKDAICLASISYANEISEVGSSSHILLLLLIALLYIFCFLIIREDLLLAEHDRYIYILRRQAILCLNYLHKKETKKPDRVILGFLPSMKSEKKENFFTLLLSLLSYAPVFLPALGLQIYLFYIYCTLYGDKIGFLCSALFVLTLLLLIFFVLAFFQLESSTI